MSLETTTTTTTRPEGLSSLIDDANDLEEDNNNNEIQVDSSDIIRLMLGYLTAQGLHESAQVLRQESGIGFSKVQLHASLPLQIRQGEWGTVLKTLQLLSCQEFTLAIQEQVLLELAETSETMELAYGILKVYRDEFDGIIMVEEDDENLGHKISKARSLEQRLAAVAADPIQYPDHSPARCQQLYGSSQTRQSRRNQLADTCQAWPLLPRNRLPILLQQAIKWQYHTGQLPYIKEILNNDDDCHSMGEQQPTTISKKKKKKKKKRKHFDLVMGVAAGDVQAVVGEPLPEEDDDDVVVVKEDIPQDIWGKVKFGKSAVCESALLFKKGLITGSSDGLIEIWDESSHYKELNVHDFPFQQDDANVVMGHKAAILALAISKDSKVLASGDANGRISIWNLQKGKCLRNLQAHEGAVTCLDFSPDAARLLTASATGNCREFGLVTQHVLQEYQGHASYIHSCHYTLIHNNNIDSNYAGALCVVTGSADGTVRLWQKGQCLRILQPQPDSSQQESSSMAIDATAALPESPAIHTVLFPPSSRLLLSSSNDDKAKKSKTKKSQHNNNTTTMVIASRSSTAYWVDWNGTILQRYQADDSSSEFTTGCLGTTTTASTMLVYLCTSQHCYVFSLQKGTCLHTIRNFSMDSMGHKPDSTSTVPSELTQILHHPFKPLLAAYSSDKTQRKGVLTVWK